jgi:hypothetical protein
MKESGLIERRLCPGAGCALGGESGSQGHGAYPGVLAYGGQDFRFTWNMHTLSISRPTALAVSAHLFHVKHPGLDTAWPGASLSCHWSAPVSVYSLGFPTVILLPQVRSSLALAPPTTSRPVALVRGHPSPSISPEDQPFMVDGIRNLFSAPRRRAPSPLHRVAGWTAPAGDVGWTARERAVFRATPGRLQPRSNRVATRAGQGWAGLGRAGQGRAGRPTRLTRDVGRRPRSVSPVCSWESGTNQARRSDPLSCQAGSQGGLRPGGSEQRLLGRHAIAARESFRTDLDLTQKLVVELCVKQLPWLEAELPKGSRRPSLGRLCASRSRTGRAGFGRARFGRSGKGVVGFREAAFGRSERGWPWWAKTRMG